MASNNACWPESAKIHLKREFSVYKPENEGFRLKGRVFNSEYFNCFRDTSSRDRHMIIACL